MRDDVETRLALAGCPVAPASARTLRRDHVQTDFPPIPYAARLASQLHHFAEDRATLVYLDLLGWALADLTIDTDEEAELRQLAADLGVDEWQVRGAHQRYLDELQTAAHRDGVVTDQEHAVLSWAAIALGVDPAVVDTQV